MTMTEHEVKTPFRSGTVGAVWVADQLGCHRVTAAKLMKERASGLSMSGGRLRLSLAEGIALVESVRQEWDRESAE